MGQDLKISQLPNQPFNIDTTGTTIDISPLLRSGKYIIPATINDNNQAINRSIDLGQLLNILKLYINQAAAEAVQEQIESIEGGGNVDVTNLQNQIIEIRNTIYDPSKYPITFIKLTDGTNNSLYQIATGLGQTSPYTDDNPIVINTTSVTPDNFYVTIQPSNYSLSGNTASTSILLDIDGSSPYVGGTVGVIVIRVYFNTSSGQYESSITINDYQNTTLTSTLEQTFNLTVTVPSGTVLQQVSATCSISGKELGSSGVKIGDTIKVGTGTIKL